LITQNYAQGFHIKYPLKKQNPIKGTTAMQNFDIKIFSTTLFLLTLFFILLSRKIILLRQKNKVSIGHNNTQEFENAIRAHGNFIEYTPLALLEIFILTQQNANSLIIIFLCTTILCGRVSHALGLNYFELKKTPIYLPRIIGMSLTFFCLFISAALIFTYAFI
jgi:uncharacterized membrane protein YecN with MAPEG domain